MLQNAYFLAKIGADTAENERYFAEILPKTGNYPTGPPGRKPGWPAPRVTVLLRGRCRPRGLRVPHLTSAALLGTVASTAVKPNFRGLVLGSIGVDTAENEPDVEV